MRHKDRVTILLEEYRVLYSLLTFRLEAIDQRIPLSAGTLVALITSSSAFTSDQRLVLLLLVPAACIWLHRTAVAHTRSKEDVLRRIDEIERCVNALAAEELLVFQSRHPNRKRFVGGRSGFGSVLAIMAVGFFAIGLALLLFFKDFAISSRITAGYIVYTAFSMAELLRATFRLARYRSLRVASPPPPVFEIRSE